MTKLAATALLALAGCSLVGCHRPQADQPTPGADAQAQTAAKTVVDLQAADDAAQGPAPQIEPARVPHEEKAKPIEPVDTPADTNDADTVETNAT